MKSTLGSVVPLAMFILFRCGVPGMPAFAKYFLDFFSIRFACFAKCNWTFSHSGMPAFANYLLNALTQVRLNLLQSAMQNTFWTSPQLGTPAFAKYFWDFSSLG